ncbi:MAG TPA: hypothetical protein VFU15_09095 [Bacteroidia bacterium]|nr:hypothetical protein [Bacteroidia bacterium]
MNWLPRIFFFFLCSVSVPALNAAAGSDTLNRYNIHHKKNGFWVQYLDSVLNPVDSVNAFYYGYEKYDNGDQVFRFFAPWPNKLQGYRFSHEGQSPVKGVPVLLDGTFTWYYASGVNSNLVAEIQVFRNGRPVYFNTYHRTASDTVSFFNEILYFDRRYNGVDGTFYYEETSNEPGVTPGPIVTYSGYFRKGKHKWSMHGKKTPGLKKKYGISIIS